MGWNGGNSVHLLTENEFSVSVTHEFVRASSAAETYDDVYSAFVNVLNRFLRIEDTCIFEANLSRRKIFYCPNISIGTKWSEDVIEFGDTLLGTVARDQFSILIPDVALQNKYPMEYGVASILCVPVQFNGELFGVICSHHKNAGFFHEDHRRLYELIAEIAASLLARIRQKIELNQLKLQLEQLLEDKKEALNIAVETVSNQFSELKFQRDKREVLLREVHHRVNNNLQIISSLVSLYLNETKDPDRKTLREIQSRIQILSSIHLILLKSLELSEISLSGFLEDLSSSLRYNSNGSYLSLEFSVFGIQSPFSLNTLIPMGMLIHELVQLAIQKFWNEGDTAEIELHILRSEESGPVTLKMSGRNCTKNPGFQLNNENVTQTIIHALCEQLEGIPVELNPETCNWSFDFKEM